MTPSLTPPPLGARTTVERTFNALGVDIQLVDAVLGDLAEQFDARVEEQGAARARLWYARQILRSAPHLFDGAVRRGGLRARLVLGAGLVTVLLAVAGTAAFLALRDGPPVRLVSDLSDAAGNVVLNNTRPVKLPVRVLDKRGHVLDRLPVRYAWAAGAPINVTPDGTLQCSERGDAVVRATVAAMTRDLAIRCRPVEGIRAASWIDLIAGGESRELPFMGVGPDDAPVDMLRGVVRISDSTVATLAGTTVRPVSVGRAEVNLLMGDKKASIMIFVNESVSSFEHLRRDQRFVARAVHLAQGDTVRWALPKGSFWLKYVVAHDADAPPTITLQGRAVCQLPDATRRVLVTRDVFGTMCAVDGPAAVELAHGKVGAPLVEGQLILEMK